MHKVRIGILEANHHHSNHHSYAQYHFYHFALLCSYCPQLLTVLLINNNNLYNSLGWSTLSCQTIWPVESKVNGYGPGLTTQPQLIIC